MKDLTAEEIKKEILPLMYCYFGSGMLTDDYNEKVANNNADKCIKIMEQYAKQKVLEDRKRQEDFFCDNNNIHILRNTLGNAEWRRVIKCKIEAFKYQ